MKTMILKCLFVISMTALAAFGAPVRRVVVQVPFDFVAGSSKLPAGQYSVGQDDADRAVYITNMQTGAGVILLAEGNTTGPDAVRTSVNFVKVNNQYVMKVVRIAGGSGFLMRTVR